MKFRLSITGILLSCVSALAFAPPTSADVFSIDEWQQRVGTEGSIDRLGRLYLELLMEENPVRGVQFGIHGKEGDPSWYDRRLPDASLEAAARFSAARKRLKERLDAIDPEPLARADQIDLHILKNRVALDQLQVTRLILRMVGEGIGDVGQPVEAEDAIRLRIVDRREPFGVTGRLRVRAAMLHGAEQA